MRLVDNPNIYVLGRQTIDQSELDRFLADHGVSWSSDTEVASQHLCETAGRLCYMSFAKPRPGGNEAYLGHIKESGHGSVLEHAVWNLLVTGVSRSLTHELVRHRAGVSPSQLSQRYVDSSDVAFVVPSVLLAEVGVAREYMKAKGRAFAELCLELDPQPEGDGAYFGLRWLRSMERAQRDYEVLSMYLFDKAKEATPDGTSLPEGGFKTQWTKSARQAARSVLPNATETKIFITANARALRNIIEQRGSRYAEPEIRGLAVRLWELMVVEAPNLFGDYQKTELPDGSYELTTEYRKV